MAPKESEDSMIQIMTTLDRVTEVCKEANKAGKTWAVCYMGETAIIIVQNPERIDNNGVPNFYVSK